LSKPVDPPALLAIVTQLLSNELGA